jgi:phosphoglycerate dehydrogenase-like enzyme
VLAFLPDTEASERMDMAGRYRALGLDVRLGPRFSTPADEMAQEVGSAEILAVALGRVDARVIDAAPALRLVVKCGIGTENVDLEAARARGIGVLRTAGVNVRGAAEYVIAVALQHGRRLVELDRAVREGRWAETRLECSGLLASLPGKTLGIVGLGAIGREVARLANAHGMTVLAADPYLDPVDSAALGAKLVSLDRLLGESDIVSLHVILDDSTHHLFGAAQFARMKPTALFVNASRGGVVDTAALVAALRAGTVAHAALDVLETEPPADDHPIRALKNVTLTPHLAGCTDHGFDEIGAKAAALTGAWLAGEELPADCVVVQPGPPP